MGGAGLKNTLTSTSRSLPAARTLPPPRRASLQSSQPTTTMAALQPHPTIQPIDAPVLVLINDGWGVNTEDQFNAVFSADTPVFDRLATVGGRFRTVQVNEAGDWLGFRGDAAGGGGLGGAVARPCCSLALADAASRHLSRSTPLPSHRRTARPSACRRTTTWATRRSATTRWVSLNGGREDSGREREHSRGRPPHATRWPLVRSLSRRTHSLFHSQAPARSSTRAPA